MGRHNTSGRFYVLPFLFPLLIISCNRNKEIAFPAEEAEFNIPQAKKLRMANPVPVSWDKPDSNSIQKPVTRKFDFGAVIPKKINTGSFQPFEKPLEEKKFSWEGLPDSAFNLNDLKAEKLVYKMSMVPEPTVMPAQPPRINSSLRNSFPQISQSEGLPSNEIYDIVQDSDGQFWFLCGGQLFRYNGDFFENFKLPDNPSLIRMMIGSDGLLWLGCDRGGGVIVFDPQALVQWHIPILSNIFTITRDHNGLYWVGGRDIGLQVIDWKNKTTRKVNFNSGEQAWLGTVSDIMRDSKDRMWISSNGRAYVLNKEQNNFKIIGTASLLSCPWFWRASEDSAGRIYLSYRNCEGFTIVQPDQETFTYVGPEQGFKGYFTSVHQGYNNFLFAPTDSFLFVISPDLKSARKISTNTDLSSPIWYAHTMIDKTGLLWLGSISNGIHLVDTRGIMAQYLNVSSGLSENNVFGLAQDNDQNLWLGLNQTTFRSSGKLNMINAAQNEIYDFTGALDSIFYRTSGITIDKQGKIWVALFGRGLIAIDYKQSSLWHYGANQGIDPIITSIGTDQKGRIWVGHINKISMIDPQSGQIHLLKNILRDSADRVQDMLEDADHQIWISTLTSGLYKLSPDLSTISSFGTSEGLAGSEVGSIIQDKQKRIWAATNKGINVIDEQNQIYYFLGKNEGMADNAIYTVFKDSGRIYAGTAQGLTVIENADLISPAKGELKLKFKTIDKDQGLGLLDFNSDIALKLHDGRLAFGIDFQALTLINPVITDSSKPETLITAIQLNDRRHSFYSLKSAAAVMDDADTLYSSDLVEFYTKPNLPKDSGFLITSGIRTSGSAGGNYMPAELQLPYEFNSIRFSFTSTNYKDPAGTRYRYILQGIDKNWSAITTSPITETYRDLGPGSYTFKVAAANADGLWSLPAIFNFAVKAPWWRTWWAYFIYSAMAFALISAIIRYRSRHLVWMNNQLEEKIKLRTKELSNSIEELKRTQGQLIQSEKMASLGELTAGIAHEIQNPLNFVNNFSEVNDELADELSEEIDAGNTNAQKDLLKEIKSNNQKISHHGKRADSIVKSMLQHSRSNAGVKEEVNINALADEYMRLAYHGMRARDKLFNATLESDFDPAAAKAPLIQQEIGRVLLNLFNNAFYAVNEKQKQKKLELEKEKEGEKQKQKTETEIRRDVMPDVPGMHAVSDYQPQVSVSTKKKGNKIEITVRDNGNGIPEKVIDKIFQPFFTTKPTGQGTGLGLSLSYDIIKAHGGDFKVNSTEGQGSEFLIILNANS